MTTGRFTTLGQQDAGLLVPAYVYPTAGLWPAIIAAGAAGGIRYAVANVSAGPGLTADTNWASAITAAMAAGVTVLGYIDISYGTVALADAETAAGLWQSLYGVGDIYLDHVPADAAGLAYAGALAGWIRGLSPGCQVVLGHAAVPIAGYAQIGDVLVVFEDAVSAWPVTPAAWMASFPPGKFAALVYSVPDFPAAAAVVNQALGLGIGSVFAADSAGLWNDVPPYWLYELAQVSGLPEGYLPLATGPVLRTCYKQQGTSAAPSATVNTYGAPVTLPLPDSGFGGVLPVSAFFTPSGVASGEVLTMQFTATFSDGGSQTSPGIVTAAGSNSNVPVNSVQHVNFMRDGAILTGVAYECQSSISSSAASCKLTVSGANTL